MTMHDPEDVAMPDGLGCIDDVSCLTAILCLRESVMKHVYLALAFVGTLAPYAAFAPWLSGWREL